MKTLELLIEIQNYNKKFDVLSTHLTQKINKKIAELELQYTYMPDENCPDCKGSGGIQVGDGEYNTCSCVGYKEKKTVAP